MFDLIRNISDPEHPNSLEELRVLRLEHIEVRIHRACIDPTRIP